MKGSEKEVLVENFSGFVSCLLWLFSRSVFDVAELFGRETIFSDFKTKLAQKLSVCYITKSSYNHFNCAHVIFYYINNFFLKISARIDRDILLMWTIWPFVMTYHNFKCRYSCSNMFKHHNFCRNYSSFQLNKRT